MDAHGRVRQWIEANMRDLMPEEPKVVTGETVFDSIAHPQEQTMDESMQNRGVDHAAAGSAAPSFAGRKPG